MEKTFILKWNPAISSVDLNDWDFWVRKQAFLTPNWSVFEHEKVCVGDRWVMLRVGNGNTGIVGYGTFCSNPYQAGDWSGKGRVTYYADLKIGVLVPHSEPLVTTQQLEELLPEIEWKGGHSGMCMETEDADLLWNTIIESQQQRRIVTYEDVCIEPGLDMEIEGWENLKALFPELSHQDLFTSRVFHDMVTLRTEHVYGESVFTFTVLLHKKFVLPVICTGLQRIHTNIYGDMSYKDDFQIWFDGYHYHLNINEVEVICEELRFGKSSHYGGDAIAVTI